MNGSFQREEEDQASVCWNVNLDCIKANKLALIVKRFLERSARFLSSFPVIRTTELAFIMIIGQRIR